jgi:hypothetical protein
MANIGPQVLLHCRRQRLRVMPATGRDEPFTTSARGQRCIGRWSTLPGASTCDASGQIASRRVASLACSSWPQRRWLSTTFRRNGLRATWLRLHDFARLHASAPMAVTEAPRRGNHRGGLRSSVTATSSAPTASTIVRTVDPSYSWPRSESWVPLLR